MTEPQPTAPTPSPPPATPEPPRPVWLRVWREVADLLRGLDLQATVAMVVAMVAMIASHHQGDTWFYRSNFAKSTMNPHLTCQVLAMMP